MSFTRQVPPQKQPEDPRPTILVDRSLGRVVVPDGVRALGFTVFTLWDIYGKDAEESLADPRWIADGAANDWVMLTWDMLREPEIRATIKQSGAKVFRIERQFATAQRQVTVFTFNQHRVIQRARRRGGWIDVIREKRVDRYWPP